MAKATEIDIEARAKAGRENFLNGYNCAQSVIAAFADIYPSDDIDTLLRLSASFGGGMGRLRMTCGAASGMFMLAGLENGSATPRNMEARTRAGIGGEVQRGKRFVDLRRTLRYAHRQD